MWTNILFLQKLIHNHRKYKSTLFCTTVQKETNNKTKLKMMVTKLQYKKNLARKNREKETKLKLVVYKRLIEASRFYS